MSELLQQAVTYDQLRVGELACFETIARRMQYWEDYYCQMLADKESGSGTGTAEQSLFMGSRSRGSALVSPDLRDYVATSLKDQSAIQKERRKAKEERWQQDTQPKSRTSRQG